MSAFIFPMCILVIVFWLSFWTLFYFVRRAYFKPLDRRIRRLEKLTGPNTQDFSQPQYQTPPQPPRTPRSRYVTVEREMNSNWVRHQ